MKVKDFLGVFLLALLWSPTFLLIRLGVHDVSPITLTWMRLLFACLMLLIICLLRQVSLKPYLRDWKSLLIAGILNNVLAFTLCAAGEVYADSSTAGIIEGSVPLYTMLISFVILGQRKISGRQLLGGLVGFAGLMVILLPTVNYEEQGIAMGVLLLNLMAASFASGFLYSERTLDHIPALPAATLQVCAATLILTPICFIVDQPWVYSGISWKVTGMAAVLGIVGTAFPWIVYFNLVKRIGASYVAFATLLLPVFAFMWGVVFLAEPAPWYKFVGAGVTLLSVLLVGPTGKVIVDWWQQRRVASEFK